MCIVREGVEDNSKIFGLSTWKSGVTMNELRNFTGSTDFKSAIRKELQVVMSNKQLTIGSKILREKCESHIFVSH